MNLWFSSFHCRLAKVDIFLGDKLVFRTSPQEHYANLSDSLFPLYGSNSVLNVRKHQLAIPENDLLIYVISANSVRFNEGNARAITECSIRAILAYFGLLWLLYAKV